MAADVFWLSAAVAVLLIGGGFVYLVASVGSLLAQVRTTVLPNLDLTLTEVQKNLNRVEELAKDVDTTVGEANQLVHSANRTVQTVEDGLVKFNKHVATPTIIAVASARHGANVAWQAFQAVRARRAARKAAQAMERGAARSDMAEVEAGASLEATRG